MSYEDEEFLRQRQAAVERMNEMSARSKIYENAHTMPPTPSFIRVSNRTNANVLPKEEEKRRESTNTKTESIKHISHSNKTGNSIFNGLSLPFDLIKSDKDVTLILGLLLLLINEKADKKLLLALLYILF